MDTNNFIKEINEDKSFECLGEIPYYLDCEIISEGNDIKNIEGWFEYATNYYKLSDGIVKVRGGYKILSDKYNNWTTIARINGFCKARKVEQIEQVKLKDLIDEINKSGFKSIKDIEDFYKLKPNRILETDTWDKAFYILMNGILGISGVYNNTMNIDHTCTAFEAEYKWDIIFTRKI